MWNELIPHLNAALSHSLILSAFFCFIGGLLASLTPCVYPLIPVVATYIGSKAVGKKDRLSLFWLSLSYVLGMGVVYSSLGMFAALTGTLFGRIATNPWSYFVVANVFILLGLNVLDVIPLPVISPKNTSRPGVVGAFVVGATSGLVTSPCTTPVLGAVLIFVAKTQNILWGAVLLFSFSLGMGLLLLIVGSFSGFLASLPKPGKWMQVVKMLFGLGLIAIGEYFLIKMGRVL